MSKEVFAVNVWLEKVQCDICGNICTFFLTFYDQRNLPLINLTSLLVSELAFRLIVTPKKGAQEFRKRHLNCAKLRWTCSLAIPFLLRNCSTYTALHGKRKFATMEKTLLRLKGNFGSLKFGTRGKFFYENLARRARFFCD